MLLPSKLGVMIEGRGLAVDPVGQAEVQVGWVCNPPPTTPTTPTHHPPEVLKVTISDLTLVHDIANILVLQY